ncbi:coiled-coil domain-containing protein 97 [Oncorhynchus tshawytscha]|uniref:coiled-coil domain-containing protein 97 n=1 Tax=Oncorhynchus tshawytscha TaxID=74940 RepID=UPI001C3E106E|nr:coiled-coil domain-containing protein 97 [Oncorhynchus tshawytscha]
MWGEIDPVPEPSPPVSVEPVFCRQPDPRRPQPDPRGTGPASSCSETAHTEEDEPQDNQADPIGVCAMVEVVAVSGIQVKSQQVGEAELTIAQRREELLRQYRTKPLVFLERYQAHLKPQHLSVFCHLTSDPRAQYYCREVRRRAAGRTNRTRVRNQRYAALRELQREGQYFSEDQMRSREPLLYEQYIGQYLTEEELLHRSLEAMQGGSGEERGPGGAEGGLAHLLLTSYQERLIQSRLQEEQDREEEEEEGEEGKTQHQQGKYKNSKVLCVCVCVCLMVLCVCVSHGTVCVVPPGGGLGAEGYEPTPQEKALLRDEFITQMYQRFLDGHDKDFNYSEVDGNPDYDNLDIVNRDAEEKYFDEDEEEDEEEEEDMTIDVS